MNWTELFVDRVIFSATCSAFIVYCRWSNFVTAWQKVENVIFASTLVHANYRAFIGNAWAWFSVDPATQFGQLFMHMSRLQQPDPAKFI